MSEENVEIIERGWQDLMSGDPTEFGDLSRVKR
jgi:hypothetical protein